MPQNYELGGKVLLRIGTKGGGKKPFPPQGSFKMIMSGGIPTLFQLRKAPERCWYWRDLEICRQFCIIL